MVWFRIASRSYGHSLSHCFNQKERLCPVHRLLTIRFYQQARGSSSASSFQIFVFANAKHGFVYAGIYRRNFTSTWLHLHAKWWLTIQFCGQWIPWHETPWMCWFSWFWFTLVAGTSALLVNIFTCTQAKRVFNPLHMRSSAQAENSFRQFHLAILELEMINT